MQALKSDAAARVREHDEAYRGLLAAVHAAEAGEAPAEPSPHRRIEPN